MQHQLQLRILAVRWAHRRPKCLGLDVRRHAVLGN